MSCPFVIGYFSLDFLMLRTPLFINPQLGDEYEND